MESCLFILSTFDKKGSPAYLQSMDKYRLDKRGIMLYREVHVRYAVCLRYWTPPQWLIGGGGQGVYPQLFLLVIFFKNSLDVHLSGVCVTTIVSLSCVNNFHSKYIGVTLRHLNDTL